MAKASELTRLIRELQAQGLGTRDVARALRLELEPSDIRLRARDVALREAARQASTNLGQGEAERAAAGRRLRKIERSVAKEDKGGLGTALKKAAQPKKRRQKPMRELARPTGPGYSAAGSRAKPGPKRGDTSRANT